MNNRRSDSWIEIGIYVVWTVTAFALIVGVYVAVHFIRKFW